jgi:outer membrane immunogenic protein
MPLKLRLKWHGPELSGKRCFVSGAILAGLIATTSELSAAEPYGGPDWTGFYLGIGGGYFDTDNKISDPVGGVFSSFNTGTDGGLIGGYLGYNYQMEQIVLGLDADIYYGYGGKTALAALPVPSVLDDKEGITWAVRGRLGYVMGAFMPYVTGGYAGMIDKKSFAVGFVGSQSEALHGWTIGGGFEYMFTQNWLTRVDYQYKDFADRTFFSGGPPPAISSKTKINQITVGVAYKF